MRSELWGLGPGWNCLGGDSAMHSLPHSLEIMLHGADIVHFASGVDHALAVTNGGQVLAWGSSSNGKLGVRHLHGSCIGQQLHLSTSPVLVGDLQGRRILRVACGAEFSAAVSSDGELFVWGGGLSGRLGLGHTSLLPCRAGHVPYVPVPVRVEALQGLNIVQAACGDQHCMALTDRGEVFAWGNASLGRLGIGSAAHRASNQEVHSPMRVEALQGERVQTLACGMYNSACATEQGRLYTWGSSCLGMLGLGDQAELKRLAESPHLDMDGGAAYAPVAVEALGSHAMTQVTVGEQHCLAVACSGLLFAWGWAGDGALGPAVGGERVAWAPVLVEAVQRLQVAQAAAGRGFSLAADALGRVLAWGRAPPIPSKALDTAGWGGAEEGAGRGMGEPRRVRGLPEGEVLLPAWCSPLGLLLLCTPEGRDQENQPLPQQPGAAAARKRARESDDSGVCGMQLGEDPWLPPPAPSFPLSPRAKRAA